MLTIDREKLYQEIEALPATMSVALNKDYCEGMRAMKNWVLDIIANAMTIDDEQEGEWIRSSPFTDTMECSFCGYNIYSEEIETPYCPWCGKRLKGKFDDKDCDENV